MSITIYILIGIGAAIRSSEELDNNALAFILIALAWPILLGAALADRGK
jgi:hypothetical protein